MFKTTDHLEIGMCTVPPRGSVWICNTHLVIREKFVVTSGEKILFLRKIKNRLSVRFIFASADGRTFELCNSSESPEGWPFFGIWLKAFI